MTYLESHYDASHSPADDCFGEDVPPHLLTAFKEYASLRRSDENDSANQTVSQQNRAVQNSITSNTHPLGPSVTAPRSSVQSENAKTIPNLAPRNKNVVHQYVDIELNDSEDEDYDDKAVRSLEFDDKPKGLLASTFGEDNIIDSPCLPSQSTKSKDRKKKASCAFKGKQQNKNGDKIQQQKMRKKRQCRYQAVEILDDAKENSKAMTRALEETRIGAKKMIELKEERLKEKNEMKKETCLMMKEKEKRKMDEVKFNQSYKMAKLELQQGRAKSEMAKINYDEATKKYEKAVKDNMPEAYLNNLLMSILR